MLPQEDMIEKARELSERDKRVVSANKELLGMREWLNKLEKKVG